MDTKEFILPVSGSTIIVRAYTTQADDEQASQILYDGVLATKDDKNSSFQFPVGNILRSEDSYIARLVLSIDGKADDIRNRLLALRSKDYAALATEVKKIVDVDSPKVSAADRNKADNSIQK